MSDCFDEDSCPCPCEYCGEWFDLYDGVPSQIKKNIVICPECGKAEDEAKCKVSDLKRGDMILYEGEDYIVTNKYRSEKKPLKADGGKSYWLDPITLDDPDEEYFKTNLLP